MPYFDKYPPNRRAVHDILDTTDKDDGDDNDGGFDGDDDDGFHGGDDGGFDGDDDGLGRHIALEDFPLAVSGLDCLLKELEIKSLLPSDDAIAEVGRLLFWSFEIFGFLGVTIFLSNPGSIFSPKPLAYA